MGRARAEVDFDLGKAKIVYLNRVRNNMQAVVTFVQERMIDSLRSGDKSGRTYKRRSVVHIASAPGEAPATDTGRLQGAITTGVAIAFSRVTGTIFAGTNYARSLELGTPKMKARPFMRPAIINNRITIERLIGGKRIA